MSILARNLSTVAKSKLYLPTAYAPNDEQQRKERKNNVVSINRYHIKQCK